MIIRVVDRRFVSLEKAQKMYADFCEGEISIVSRLFALSVDIFAIMIFVFVNWKGFFNVEIFLYLQILGLNIG